MIIIILLLSRYCFVAKNLDSKGVAYLCAVLYGFGDNMVVITVYTVQGQVLQQKDKAAGTAAFKCLQSIGSSVSFLYATHLRMEVQLGILAIMLVSGTLMGIVAEKTQAAILALELAAGKPAAIQSESK